MKTTITEPFTDLEHSPNHHTTLLNHPELQQGAVRKQSFVRVLSSITLVSLFFVLAFVLIVLNQQNSTNTTAANSSPPEDKSSRRYSQSDRLTWERTAYHFQPQKNFIYGTLQFLELTLYLLSNVDLKYNYSWKFPVVICIFFSWIIS